MGIWTALRDRGVWVVVKSTSMERACNDSMGAGMGVKERSNDVSRSQGRNIM